MPKPIEFFDGGWGAESWKGPSELSQLFRAFSRSLFVSVLFATTGLHYALKLIDSERRASFFHKGGG